MVPCRTDRQPAPRAPPWCSLDRVAVPSDDLMVDPADLSARPPSGAARRALAAVRTARPRGLRRGPPAGRRIPRPGRRAERHARAPAAATRCPTRPRSQDALRAAGVRDGPTRSWSTTPATARPPRAPGGSCAGPGHRGRRVLDGGYAAWVAAGRPVTTTKPRTAAGDITVRPGGLPVLDADAAAERPRDGVLHRRPGRAALPGRDRAGRPGRRPHPGRGQPARPPTSPRRTAGCAPPAELRERFAAGRRTGTVGAYCGSGVTAAHTVLALHRGRPYRCRPVRRLVERVGHRPRPPGRHGGRMTRHEHAGGLGRGPARVRPRRPPARPGAGGADHGPGPRARRARPPRRRGASSPSRPTTRRCCGCTAPTTSTRSRPRRHDPFFRGGYGLGTSDNPVFDSMHEASALVAGATLAAAEAVWRGEADPGGQHRRRAAPRDAGPGLRLLRLQRPGDRHRAAARPGRRADRLRRHRRAPRRRRAGRSSTTTRGCSRSACTSRR